MLIYSFPEVLIVIIKTINWYVILHNYLNQLYLKHNAMIKGTVLSVTSQI